MKFVAFTGHRPPKIGGYDDKNPLRVQIQQEIRFVLRGLQQQNPELTAIVGGALGVDTDSARECFKLGIPYIVAVPCQNQDKKWPTASQVKYKKMLELAQEVVYVHNGEYTNSCMSERNRYMVDRADFLVAVWNGDKSGGTWNCLSYADTVQTGLTVYLIDPKNPR